MQVYTTTLSKQDKLWTSDIARHLFDEFKSEFLTLSPYQSPNALAAFYQSEVAVNHAQKEQELTGFEIQDLPLAIILHNEAEWIGVAVIETQDMGMRPDLRPWLSFFYIHPKWRSKGYSKTLLKAVIAFVEDSKDIEAIHLWCFTQSLVNFYTKVGGFLLVEKVTQHGDRENVYVMKWDKFARATTANSSL